MGMGGFFMHSRTGLATEYLGREWLRMRSKFARRKPKSGALRRGFTTRTAGQAAQPADWQPPILVFGCAICAAPSSTREDSQNGPRMKDFVAAFAAKIDGINLKSYRPLYRKARRPLELQAQRKAVCLFTVEQVHTHDFFNGSAYLNTIDAASVQRFLSFTHERYKKTVGRQFGKTIPGIFTDEPHHGFVMADTPKGWVYPHDSGWATPSGQGLAGLFSKSVSAMICARACPSFSSVSTAKDSRQSNGTTWRCCTASS